jgi:hypothetical protein
MKFKPFLITLLILVFAKPSLTQELPNANAPLTTDELREGILRIEEGVLAAKAAELLRKSMADRDALSERERALAMRELETEKQRTELAQQKADIEKARGDFYESAFNTVTKKTSGWCHVARVFTLGLAHCGR